jgi:hypothetical protein
MPRGQRGYGPMETPGRFDVQKRHAQYQVFFDVATEKGNQSSFIRQYWFTKYQDIKKQNGRQLLNEKARVADKYFTRMQDYSNISRGLKNFGVEADKYFTYSASQISLTPQSNNIIKQQIQHNILSQGGWMVAARKDIEPQKKAALLLYLFEAYHLLFEIMKQTPPGTNVQTQKNTITNPEGLNVYDLLSKNSDMKLTDKTTQKELNAIFNRQYQLFKDENLTKAATALEGIKSILDSADMSSKDAHLGSKIAKIVGEGYSELAAQKIANTLVQDVVFEALPQGTAMKDLQILVKQMKLEPGTGIRGKPKKFKRTGGYVSADRYIQVKGKRYTKSGTNKITRTRITSGGNFESFRNKYMSSNKKLIEYFLLMSHANNITMTTLGKKRKGFDQIFSEINQDIALLGVNEFIDPKIVGFIFSDGFVPLSQIIRDVRDRSSFMIGFNESGQGYAYKYLKYKMMNTEDEAGFGSFVGKIKNPGNRYSDFNSKYAQYAINKAIEKSNALKITYYFGD